MHNLVSIYRDYMYMASCSKTLTSTLTMANETQPTPSFDVVILGASGFTGKYILREALKFFNPNNPSPSKSLSIAGRNRNKLDQTLSWAAHPNPPPPIPVLIVDISNPESLGRICRQARLILNCVGPFRLHGEPVVRSCIEVGCDYVDICGEPEFMERMEIQYHEMAKEKGSLVISACGFDSIPAELGFMFHSRQWKSPKILNRVDAYLSLNKEKRTVGNFATFESAILSVANAEVHKDLRKSLAKSTRTQPQISGPPPPKAPTIDRQKELGLWAVRLPSADHIVVRRTLTTLTENPHGLPGLNESPDQILKRQSFWSTVKPAHFSMKIGTKKFLGTLRIILVGVFIGLFGKYAFGRWLLLNFPSIFSLGWFSKKGPTEDEVKSGNFKMLFVGHGFGDHASQNMPLDNNKLPDTKRITRLTGPDMGYITTSIVVIQCALVTLNQRGNLPKGGVFTPGIVFGPTDLQDRLQCNGMSFDLVSEPKVV